MFFIETNTLFSSDAEAQRKNLLQKKLLERKKQNEEIAQRIILRNERPKTGSKASALSL